MSPETVAAVAKTLALPDEAFFALDDPATTALQAQVATLVTGPPRSAPPSERRPLPELRAIGAPTHLDWQRDASFPLLLAEVRGRQREWEVHSKQNRLLMISNLSNGAVDVMPPDMGRRTTPKPPSRSGPPPDAFNASLSLVGVLRFDLLRWFPRQQMQGRLTVTVLDYDLPSNTIEVHAHGAGTAPAEGVLARSATRIAVQPAAVTAALIGVTLHVPPAVSAAEPAVLRAALRRPRRSVPAVNAPPDAGHRLLLAATLLLVQLDNASPVLLHLAVPGSLGPGEDIEAAFNLDLRGALAGRAATGDWLVYLVVGDTLTGPQPLRVDLP